MAKALSLVAYNDLESAVIFLDALQTGQPSGITEAKKVSYAMRGMSCFSAVKSGIAVLQTRVPRPAISYRCTMRSG